MWTALAYVLIVASVVVNVTRGGDMLFGLALHGAALLLGVG